MMHGSPELFVKAIHEQLSSVPLNDIELLLLDNHLKSPEENALAIADFLK